MISAPLLRAHLDRLSSVLLKDALEYSALFSAVEEYFQLLANIGFPEGQKPADGMPISLESGHSIGPYWAAMCVRDLLRTRQFLRGLYRAIHAGRHVFPDTVLHVLYAGTGPFAALALPMMTRFSSKEVRFTFLEVQPLSHSILHRTIDAFRFHDYVQDILSVDACAYHTDEDIHILLTETMQSALDKEPQVDITRHLIRFLHPEGYLVPDSIQVYAGLINPAEEDTRRQDLFNPPEKYIRSLKTVLELNRQTAFSLSSEFPEITIEIPKDIWASHPALYLFTDVRVFDHIRIGPWESGITVPKQIRMDASQNLFPLQVSFQYKTGRSPGFEYRSHHTRADEVASR